MKPATPVTSARTFLLDVVPRRSSGAGEHTPPPRSPRPAEAVRAGEKRYRARDGIGGRCRWSPGRTGPPVGGLTLAEHAPVLEPRVEGLAFPECPRWHEGRLWFSDMHGGRVAVFESDGTAHTIVEVPGGPGGLGWLPDGRLLVVSMRDRKVLRHDLEGLTVHADLIGYADGNANDMVVDRYGRA